MSKWRQFVNFILAAGIVLAINSSGSAQNNLTAKANSIPPPPVSTAAAESDRGRDGLAGPVRRVRTEVAKLSNASGKLVEDKRALLEVAAYDIKGNKTENQYFPVPGFTLTGKEVYKYDEKGNISEMTLLSDNGSLLSKEVYQYDFDYVGNWIKMTTSVAVVEGGKVSFEPTEVTYRSIMYYFDENMLKMAQPVSPPASAVASSSPTTGKAAAAIETKPRPVAPVESQPQRVVGGAASKPLGNQRSVTNSKLAPSLPAPVAAVNRSLAFNSLEMKNTSTGAGASKEPVVVLDSEPPASLKPQPLLKPVSGGVLNGTALSLPPPSYPDAARRMRIAGVVTVQVVVDETGKVITAEASDGPQALRGAAVQAALKARFSPTKLSGRPVKVTGIIDYKFALSQ